MKNTKILLGVERQEYLGTKYVTEGREDLYKSIESLCERFILYFEDGTSLTIWEESDICPSGWTTCSYGYFEWGKKTPHKMSELKDGSTEVTIEEDKWEGMTIESALDGKEVATIDKDGGDIYYPAGFIYLDLELFK